MICDNQKISKLPSCYVIYLCLEVKEIDINSTYNTIYVATKFVRWNVFWYPLSPVMFNNVTIWTTLKINVLNDKFLHTYFQTIEATILKIFIIIRFVIVFKLKQKKNHILIILFHSKTYKKINFMPKLNLKKDFFISIFWF